MLGRLKLFFRGLSAENEDAGCSRAPRHGHVGVDPIADNREIPGSDVATAHQTFEHPRVGFAENRPRLDNAMKRKVLNQTGHCMSNWKYVVTEVQ